MAQVSYTRSYSASAAQYTGAQYAGTQYTGTQYTPGQYMIPIDWGNIYGGIYGTGGGATAPPPTPAPAPVTPPAPSGQSLQVALGAIPIAHDGDVISAVYHNAMRDALLQIAGFLGDQATNQQVTVNYLPALQPDNGAGLNPWKLINCHAEQDGTKHLLGWMALELPDGITITGMAGFGSLGADAPTTFQLKLVRQSIADGTQTNLGTVDLHDQTGTFNKSQTFTGNDLDRTVDNSSYEYVVVAELDPGSGANVNAKLFGFQVRGLRW
ncbi:MAG TPA: hypothetical protein VF094_03890 [Gaiellaceae bacterium]